MNTWFLKYKKKVNEKTSKKNKKDQFFRFAEKHSYNLLENFTFNREELHGK